MSVHIATEAHVPSDHSPIRKRIRILLQRLGEKIIPVKKKWGGNKKIRDASSHLCAGIYYSNDVECVYGFHLGGRKCQKGARRAQRKKSTITFFFFFLQGLQRQQKASRSYRVSETNGN